jgi:fermentation-respiration switch protein FrsA (DUF1100 family)
MAGRSQLKSRLGGVLAHRWLWLLILCVALVLLAACGPFTRAYEAVRLAEDVTAGAGPSAFKRATPTPVRRTVSYEVQGRTRLGDIYLPGGGLRARAAVVAVPGAVTQGKDDPQFVAFATSLARARFLVLAPDIPNNRSLMIGSADADVIADAVRYLAAARLGNKPKSVGLVAFSYAVGPALIAAMKPDTSKLVGFVCAVGGYFSVEAAVTYFTTGMYKNGKDAWVAGHPNPYAKWVFLMSNTARLGNDQDRRTLQAIAKRRLADEGADVSDLARELGPEGRAVYALIVNKTPDRVPALIAHLPAAVRDEMQALDLGNQDFRALQAHLILIHGKDDTLIPYTQSLALAQAVRGRASLFLIGSIGHVEPKLSSFPDIVTFWRAAYTILEERDAMPAPDDPQQQGEAHGAP